MLNNCKPLYIIALLFIFVAATATLAISEETPKITFISGSPKIMKISDNAWSVCKIGGEVNNGDRIKTLKGEAVEISFAKDGARIIKIEENSDVFIKKGSAPYSIELLNGAAMALIKGLPKGSTFEIRTPAGIAGARGTGWRSATDGAKVSVEAFENSVYAKGVDKAGNEMAGEVIVEEGWKTMIDHFEKPGALERLSDNDLERWNGWKEDLSSRSEVPVTGNRRERMDQASVTQERMIDKLGSEKENINEAMDVARIEDRQTAEDSRTTVSNSGSDEHTITTGGH